LARRFNQYRQKKPRAQKLEVSSDGDAEIALDSPLETVTDALYSPRVVRELLGRHGLRPTKSLGQNFLVDGNTLRYIVEAGLASGAAAGLASNAAAGSSEAGSGDARADAGVYEVGPGLGVLTRALAQTGAKVTTIEKDERLKPVLEETLAGLDNVRVVFKDALEFPWQHVPEGSVLVANLPYYISTAILQQLLESGRFRQLTFLVQREVALRLEAKPGDEHYGFLSALVALYGHAERLRDVSKGAFFPPPDVVSSIVRIHVDPGCRPSPGVIRVLEAVLHHRRKTLRNNLLLAGYAPQLVVSALEHAQLEPEIRGEVVALDDLVRLAEMLEP
jgi:16S rRNA (adenine1518-N6/adenine1519-N6)-dimethyltransferase